MKNRKSIHDDEPRNPGRQHRPLLQLKNACIP
jgi:hypothetical protein